MIKHRAQCYLVLLLILETQNKDPSGSESVFWKAEFIRETVVELGELTGDVVMFMFVTTDSAPQG